MSGKPNKKSWLTQEVKFLGAEKRKSYLQYKNKTITYNQYEVVRNKVNKITGNSVH